MPLDLLKVCKKWVTQTQSSRTHPQGYHPKWAIFTHPVPGSTSKGPQTIQVDEKLIHWVEVIKTDEMGVGQSKVGEGGPWRLPLLWEHAWLSGSLTLLLNKDPLATCIPQALCLPIEVPGGLLRGFWSVDVGFGAQGAVGTQPRVSLQIDIPFQEILKSNGLKRLHMA